MKVRLGFVSNSSSSSFIIVSFCNENEILDVKKYIISDVINIPNDYGGEYEFGWQKKVYNDFFSKLNFCILQYLYSKNEEWLKMIKDVLYEYLNIKDININLCIDYEESENSGKIYGYIDCNSSYVGGKNCEMFNSIENLKNFLFSKNSAIYNSNDNEE